MNIEEVMAMYDISLDFNTVLRFVSIGLTVILTSTIIPIWYVVKLEPKKILM